MQKELRRRLGTNFVFLADEIYLRAGRAVPGRAHYGDYPQIEDGIGMVRSFNNDFNAMIKRFRRHPPERPDKAYGTILTGTLFAPVIAPLLDRLNTRFGTRVHVEAVRSNYFGGDVAVAGLLTGGDLLSARDRIRGDFVVIPKHTLKSDEEILLDGMRLEELGARFGLPIYPADVDSLSRILLQKN
jgi:NifB/MoaA-like Fe-S oxidoreductase